MRGLIKKLVCAALVGAGTLSDTRGGEVILQYFGTTWAEITRRIPELAEAGYNALWLPPPFKGGSGPWSVGFDTYDRFDLGSKNQMGSVATQYGTETDLLHLMDVAHRFGFRVYFDNVMAHNGGPMPTGPPGTLQANGFVPEDFHLKRLSATNYAGFGWPTWSDEWQVLNRNPFGQDIAQESPNTSFGYNENDDYPKWFGVRHPNNPEYYLDTDLPFTAVNGGVTSIVFTFANKEPFEDVGYTNTSSIFVSNAVGNGRFDWQDLNANGQHDAGEPCEPFQDTGIDPSRADRQTAAWGYGDGKYNMGNPVSEDVNSMLFRMVRWFTDKARADGYRLDAVKHVPAYFFGKMDSPKDDANWGYGGQIQEQFNISRGFNDWNNHRDGVFDNVIPRNDALLFGEHLGDPPWKMYYVDAGMRIANDDFLNAVKNQVGNDLQGMDSPFYAVISPGQSMHYVMSHDNNYLWSGDREQAHAVLLTREGIPIVYSDGYNQSGAPSWFPKPAEVPFLGQFGQKYIPNLLDINRHFGWGYQASRWSAWDFTSYNRYDPDAGNNDGGVTVVFAMAKKYISGWPSIEVSAIFPEGARLFNYSYHDGMFPVKVTGGKIRNMDGSAIYVAPGKYYAFSWRIPDLPSVWGNSLTNIVRPITILQNGQPAGAVTVTRKDGRNGDPAFNPYGLPNPNTTNYSYDITLPRVTSSSNLTFIALSDGSAANILMKLDGGVDLNSQMSVVSQSPGTRDNPPGVAKDKFLGYEQMRFVRRIAEKFAATNTVRNGIGSPGAETIHATIGSSGFTIVPGTATNLPGGPPSWVFHDPIAPNHDGLTKQFDPAPQSAAGVPVTLYLKVGYTGLADRAYLYYTTDGSNPEGSDGVGRGSTQVLPMSHYTNAPPDGGGVAGWWRCTLPPFTNGTALRYKLSAQKHDIAFRFPWSADDINLIPRMQTCFEITNFNAATVLYYPHNDWGSQAVGLKEGFHVLRTKSFLGRDPGHTAIYREETQTFYYDASRPTGRVVVPATNGITLTNSTQAVRVRTDMTVEEVWYKIEDSNPANDDGVTGIANGNNAWVKAGQGELGTPEPGTPPEKLWQFNYANVPTSGIATIRVLLRELSSATNLNLSDEAGHFTTLLRNVNTGGSAYQFNIVQPNQDGATLGAGSNLVGRFSKGLATGLDDNQLAAAFALKINGAPATPSAWIIDRDVSATEHAVTAILPNFYNGSPGFLHTLAIVFNRDGFPALEAQRQAFSVVNEDGNGDGIPDAWEIHWGLAPGSLSPAADYDLDGSTDWEEYIANTDPTDPFSRFTVSGSLDTPNQTIHLQFPAGLNRQFHVWATDRLVGPTQAWTRLNSDPLDGNGQTMLYDHSLGEDQSFFRLQAVLPSGP